MKSKKFAWSLSLAIVVMVLVLAFDLTTKYVVDAKLALGESADFLPGFINFVSVHNDGAAWNIFSGKQPFLIILTFVLIAVFLAFYIVKLVKSKSPVSKTLGVAVGLIVGGCFGNLFDRIAFGYVRDFINFQFFSSPVFNIADSALCIGIVVLLVYFIFIMPRENKKEGKEDKKENKE